MKTLAFTTENGIEIVSSLSLGLTLIDAAEEELATVLGTFGVSVNARGRLEVVGSVPFGGAGSVWIYDATPGEIANREVSRVNFTLSYESKKFSPAADLIAGKVYQIRASCVDGTPAGKAFAMQGAQVVDV